MSPDDKNKLRNFVKDKIDDHIKNTFKRSMLMRKPDAEPINLGSSDIFGTGKVKGSRKKKKNK